MMETPATRAARLVNQLLREVFAAIGLAYFIVSAIVHHYSGHWWPFT